MRRFLLLCSMMPLAVVLMGGECSRERVESISHMNEGIAAAQNGSLQQASAALEHATVVDPTNEEAFYNLALVCIKTQRFELAKDALNEAISIKNNVGSYHDKLGVVLSQLGDWEEATKSFQRAIEIEPSLFKPYFRMAQAHEQLGDVQSALRDYTEAIRHGPRFVQSYMGLARNYADLGHHDLSVQVLRAGLEAAIPYSQQEAQLMHLLGTILKEQGKADNAVAAFREAVKRQPDMWESLVALGWVYAEQGKDELAREAFKQFLAAGATAPPHYIGAAQGWLANHQEIPSEEAPTDAPTEK